MAFTRSGSPAPRTCSRCDRAHRRRALDRRDRDRRRPERSGRRTTCAASSAGRPRAEQRRLLPVRDVRPASGAESPAMRAESVAVNTPPDLARCVCTSPDRHVRPAPVLHRNQQCGDHSSPSRGLSLPDNRDHGPDGGLCGRSVALCDSHDEPLQEATAIAQTSARCYRDRRTPGA
jgi:hypothetical protein